MYFNIDVNECTNGENDCDENASCENEPGLFTCKCNDGYTGE